jgi:predicted nucleotidyltransferase component of viral defense system
MHKVAKLSIKEREVIFRNTAQKCGMNEAIVEKDFWVCWTMDYLFQHSKWKNHFAFKGGTSLSKGYTLIERFSEDIDLILDWRLLGYKIDEPWNERSKTKQAIFNKETDNKTAIFLRDDFLPSLNNDFSNILNGQFKLHIDYVEPQTVNFAYPQIFEDSSILKIIRMEIGALAAWTPTQILMITPYAAEKYPNIFNEPSTNVLTVSAERTFWEKITILHKEAFRTNGNFPERYSRHYYDLYCMNSSHVKQNAFSNLELLKRVATFKARFYPTNAARYDLAKPGTIRLIPPTECMKALENDYEHMQNMIYGQKPTFSNIMDCIQSLEIEINNL